MRTQKEIIAKIEEVQKSGNDPMGVTRSDLIDFLDFKHAKPYLAKGTTKKEWDENSSTLDHDFLVGEIKKYIPFAFTKALQQRGLSAIRSLNHFHAWLWLTEDLENFDDFFVYDDYGIEHLQAIADYFDVDYSDFK